MDKAEHGSTSSDIMTSVEECVCPPNYDGLSCEVCLPLIIQLNVPEIVAWFHCRVAFPVSVELTMSSMRGSVRNAVATITHTRVIPTLDIAQ